MCNFVKPDFIKYMLQVKCFSFNPFAERCVLLWDESQEAVVVDPGCYDAGELDELEAALSSQKLCLKAIWLTHGHFDHIYGVKALAAKYQVPVYMHHDDKLILENNLLTASHAGLVAPDIAFGTEDLAEGQVLGFGNTRFSVILTPGHTPGGVCFYDEPDKLLLCGDSLFCGSIGRTDLPGGDYDKLIVSIMDSLMGLPGDVDVIPGHGPVTNIGKERTHNPFLQPFNEPEEEVPFDGE